MIVHVTAQRETAIIERCFISANNRYLQNILHGTETRICTSLQKTILHLYKTICTCIQLMAVCTTANMKQKGKYSWNDCCLLSGSLQIAPHILRVEISFYSLGVVKI